MTRTSLVVRVTAVVVTIIALAFAAWVAIVDRSAAVAFTEVRNEVVVGPRGSDADADLIDAVMTARQIDGWAGVERLAAGDRFTGDAGDFLVADEEGRVAVATRPEWIGARVFTEAGGFVIRGESLIDGRATEFELVTTDPVELAGEGGAVWGRLFVLPAESFPIDSRAFAFRVWRLAAAWLVVVGLVAMSATAWVLRRSLAPVDRLTTAARELQSGRVPAPLKRGGSAEFGELVDAFNAATEAIAGTERMRRELIADLAHELRTPVTNIRGQLEALERGLVVPDRDFGRLMQAEAAQLERLIGDFQELATSDAGQLRLDLQPLPLRPVLRDILGPLADAAGAAWRVDGPDDLEAIADPTRLRQVVANLMENSARHRPDGLEIVVRIRAAGQDAVFSFHDNGPGIPPADQPRIFERLYRAEKSRSRATGGAGLGLAIVKGLVEAMGGSISYVAGDTPGATFDVVLPRP